MEQRGLPPRPVLGADTEVVLDGVIFGKPRDAAHAAQMLARLSGRRHDVLTGVALKRWRRRRRSRCRTSHVTFRRLSRRRDRALRRDRRSRSTRPARYAIQGRAGAFVTRLDGSYSGVMGLPLFETAELLAKAGIPVL